MAARREITTGTYLRRTHPSRRGGGGAGGLARQQSCRHADNGPLLYSVMLQLRLDRQGDRIERIEKRLELTAA